MRAGMHGNSLLAETDEEQLGQVEDSVLLLSSGVRAETDSVDSHHCQKRSGGDWGRSARILDESSGCELPHTSEGTTARLAKPFLSEFFFSV